MDGQIPDGTRQRDNLFSLFETDLSKEFFLLWV